MSDPAVTEVVLVGTGFPRADPKRAGPGLLVRRGELSILFDCGRGVCRRLVEAGGTADGLGALFVTHHHHDHLLDADDIVLRRWLSADYAHHPLPVVAPTGACQRFFERFLLPWEDDIAIRLEHVGGTHPPSVDVTAFGATDRPREVWRQDGVTVSAVLVDHPPVVPAVAYRIDTPEGSVVFSGDTRVSEVVEHLARGADLLVHEVFLDRVAATARHSQIADYHANSIELGGLARRAGVPRIALTHIIPAPATEADEEEFRTDLRAGGYEGDVVVGRDLWSTCLGPAAPAPTA